MAFCSAGASMEAGQSKGNNLPFTSPSSSGYFKGGSLLAHMGQVCIKNDTKEVLSNNQRGTKGSTDAVKPKYCKVHWKLRDVTDPGVSAEYILM